MNYNLDHAAFVANWLDARQDLTSEACLDLFGPSLAALWDSASVTLGDVTLTAIVDRVLCHASERFPFLSALKVGEKDGIQVDDLRGQAGTLNVGQVREGLRFVLVEFLEVIGTLTAEILTPDLHAALLKVAPGKSAPVNVAPDNIAARERGGEPSPQTSGEPRSSHAGKDRSS